jgi:hypothetical protein
VVYDLLMKAAAETTLAVAADPKRFGARVGVRAVLHTWGSALTHPHVHMIVPGGIEDLLADVFGRFLAKWVVARFAQRLPPLFEDVSEGSPCWRGPPKILLRPSVRR